MYNYSIGEEIKIELNGQIAKRYKGRKGLVIERNEILRSINGGDPKEIWYEIIYKIKMKNRKEPLELREWISKNIVEIDKHISKKDAQYKSIELTNLFPEIKGQRREKLCAAFSEAIEWGILNY